jgi:hypothetical protein
MAYGRLTIRPPFENSEGWLGRWQAGGAQYDEQ